MVHGVMVPSLQALPPPSHPAHTHPIWALKGVSLDTLDAAGRVRRPMRPHTFAHTQRGHRHPPTPLAHAGRGRICAGGASRATDAVGVVAGRAHGAVRTRLLVLEEACEAGLARRAAHFVLILATRACCGRCPRSHGACQRTREAPSNVGNVQCGVAASVASVSAGTAHGPAPR